MSAVSERVSLLKSLRSKEVSACNQKRLDERILQLQAEDPQAVQDALHKQSIIDKMTSSQPRN